MTTTIEKQGEKSGPKPLSPEETAKLLELLKSADSVELKLTVPETKLGFRSTATSLEMDPLDAQLRQIFFFDTRDLLLNQHGVVVRARRSQGGADDSVIKLRPVIPDELSKKLRSQPGFGVEVDALPGGFVCSASFKSKATKANLVREASLGLQPIRKLFTKSQAAFFADHAPDGVTLDSLEILGPMNVLKLKFAPSGFGRKMVAEMWLYPDGSRILELSTKCKPAEAFQVSAQARAFLGSRGVDLTGEQQTKTATALTYFTSILPEAGGG